MSFDWNEEIKEPLDKENLKRVEQESFIKALKQGLFFFFIAVVAGLIAYFLNNAGRVFLRFFFFAIALLALVPFLVALLEDTDDSFEFLSINNSEHFKKYHELLQSGCPEVEAFDKAIKALKRFPTKGELRALNDIVSEFLREKARKAFLERDWNTLDETLSKSIARSTTEKC